MIFTPFKNLKEKIQTQKALAGFEEEMLHFWTYLFLIFLSALIASFGILRENQPVIIGAMLISPLVSPFVGIPLGIITKNYNLSIKSVFYAITGTVAFFGVSFLIGHLFDVRHTKIWLLSTTTIEYADIAIALLGGCVAALAISSEKIQNKLSGAAIALALAPPLSISGINFASGNEIFFKTALYLFLINAGGLILMGFIIFLIFGFHKKEKGLE